MQPFTKNSNVSELYLTKMDTPVDLLKNAFATF